MNHVAGLFCLDWKLVHEVDAVSKNSPLTGKPGGDVCLHGQIAICNRMSIQRCESPMKTLTGERATAILIGGADTLGEATAIARDSCRFRGKVCRL